MKAIDILFDRIDELNAEIKTESDTSEKVRKALEIEQVIRAVKELDALRWESYLNFDDKHYQRRYDVEDYI